MDLSKVRKPIGKHPIKQNIGSLYHKSALFFRQELASAKGIDGTEYSICQNMKGPLQIQSSKTGNVWLITLHELVDLALANGVDQEQEWRDLAE